MKKFMLHGFLTMLATGMIVGCGGGGGGTLPANNPNPPAATTDVVNMGNTKYLIPNGVNAKSVDIGGQQENMLTSGTHEEVGGFVHTLPGTTTAAGSDLLSNVKRMQKGVETVFSALSNDTTTIDTISLLSTQSYQTPYTFTLSSYSIKTLAAEQPLNLAAKIVNIMNGGAGTSGIAIADPSAPTDTEFRFLLLYGEYQGSMFYIAVVVPSSQYTQYATLISMITNAARVAPVGTALQSTSQGYTVSAGSGMADFLFVVDDSGSMSDNQDALSKAADQFIAEMTGSGVSYRTAIITTGRGADEHNLTSGSGTAYNVLRTYGIIENNDTLFKQELVAGTSGSATETGIWNAEQALQRAGERNATEDGVLTQLGMPKTGAKLSVIILSDEPSQYTSRSAGGVEFNVTDNLFLDRNITVFSIVEPGYSYGTTGIFDENNESQYDDLALATGGAVADIGYTVTDANGTDVLDFSYIMGKIAQEAGGASSSFVLSHPAAVIHSVTVNGTAVQHDTTNGYTYVQSSQSIVFHGTAVPPNGASISVTYEYYQ